MGRTVNPPEINGKLAAWINKQHLFFVATAPLGREHHINVSPKTPVQGVFTILDKSTVAYLDLTGSGAETTAHLMENGRITLMFVSFEDKPGGEVMR